MAERELHGQLGPLHLFHPAGYRQPRGRNLQRDGECLQFGSEQLAAELFGCVYRESGVVAGHFAFSNQPQLYRYGGRRESGCAECHSKQLWRRHAGIPDNLDHLSQRKRLAQRELHGQLGSYTCSTQPATGSLAAGTYNATVNVSSSGASNSPQSYTVAFTVSSGSTCTTSSATGTCGPYTDSSITGSGTYPIITENDVWSPPSTWSQTLYSTNPGDWYVVANFPTDSSGAIHTYPDTNIEYYDGTEPTLDSYSYMYSSFSETPDTSSTTVSDIGFDIWMNNWANEIMIQHQVVNIVPCTQFATHVVATNVTFGGSNGVPQKTWNLCQFGNEGSGL